MLERINNDGPYEPSNCKWASRKDNANNKRNNKQINYRGKTHSLAEWARILNINYTTLQSRLVRWNGDIERSFTNPNTRGILPFVL